MLDTDVDRVRADRLREFVTAQKQAAERRRVEAVTRDQRATAERATGETEALEQVLQYLDAHTGETADRSLDRVQQS